MGGMAWPCIAIKPTTMTSFALAWLFDLLHRLALMLEEASSTTHVPDPVEVETTPIEIGPSVVKYNDIVRMFHGHHDDDDEDDDETRCVICLNNIKRSGEIRELSNCSHVFHGECLDAWVNKDPTCPLCRSSL